MKPFGELYQSADWKTEKHVPVIECPDSVKSGEAFAIKATVGKEVAHPNTTEHHISWVSIYFLPDGDKFPYEVGHIDFAAHGEAAGGPNTGPAYTDPQTTVSLKISKPGTIYATSLCNIHGLWKSEKEIKLA